MKNITINQLFKPFGIMIRKFHITLFIVILVGGLSAAVLILSSVIRESSDTTNFTPGTTASSFDQETIDRLNKLQTSDQNTGPITLPAGRINPFSE